MHACLQTIMLSNEIDILGKPLGYGVLGLGNNGEVRYSLKRGINVLDHGERRLEKQYGLECWQTV